jgi:hypothetical protein
METELRSLSALAIMIEYAAIEAGLLKNKPLESMLRAALKEAKRSLEIVTEDSPSKIRRTN